jgi:hypothetical protein
MAVFNGVQGARFLRKMRACYDERSARRARHRQSPGSKVLRLAASKPSLIDAMMQRLNESARQQTVTFRWTLA